MTWSCLVVRQVCCDSTAQAGILKCVEGSPCAALPCARLEEAQSTNDKNNSTFGECFFKWGLVSRPDPRCEVLAGARLWDAGVVSPALTLSAQKETSCNLMPESLSCKRKGEPPTAKTILLLVSVKSFDHPRVPPTRRGSPPGKERIGRAFAACRAAAPAGASFMRACPPAPRLAVGLRAPWSRSPSSPDACASPGSVGILKRISCGFA